MARMHLHGDEYPLIEVKPHLSILVGPAFSFAAVAAAGLAAGFLWSPSSGKDVVDTAAGLVAGLFLARLAWTALKRLGTTVLLTDHRILVRSGVVAKRVASIPLARVGDITYRRPLMGRLLGYGELRLNGRSGLPVLEVGRLPRPDDFYRTLAAVAAHRAPARAGETPRVPLDEADTGPLPRVVV